MRQRLRFSLGWTEILGTVLLGLYLALSGLSRSFVYGQGHLERPIVVVVGLLLVAFLVYGFVVVRVLKQPGNVRLGSVLLFAVLFRLAFLPSNLIQEDDVYRYIWDGQVVLQGISPYRYAPATIRAFEPSPDGVTTTERIELATLHRLSTHRPSSVALGTLLHDEQSRWLVTRINHPEVPTIYPPVAQAVFAVSQAIVPWSPRGIRVVLLIFDGLCIMLLIAILKRLALHPSRVLIYAWSPLVLKEFANSAHMDTIPMAAVLLCMLMVLKRRWTWAAVILALGVASKYYPLALVPVVGQRLWREGRRVALMGFAVFVATLGVCFAPFFGEGFSVFRGLGTYARSWELNAGLFAGLEWGIAAFVGDHAPVVARMTVMVLFIVALVWVLRWQRGSRDPLVVTKRCFLLIGILFLLSPVQNPWYLCWVVPLLCVHPSRPWILLTGLIPLYYLGFFVEYHYPEPRASALWTIIKIVEYAPFYVFMMWEMWCRRRGRPLVGVGAPVSVFEERFSRDRNKQVGLAQPPRGSENQGKPGTVYPFRR